ncbi:MAG: TnpV protein [Clostridiales bacterium]|nr:TnpV protein [Clostridiales bacterium]
MEKSLFEQMGGKYEQQGDYLLPNLIGPEEEQTAIGIWGQRHARYLKQRHKILYFNLLTSGKLNSYLASIDEQAEDMLSWLVKQMAEKQGITEQLKETNQMLWVGRMNACRNAAAEIVNNELIFA